ncbi:hypothetical protein F4802DRAFT_597065 [Xylaria palmicola]|nr:hypothetical protein F4802DRAFT_597065 [Xylaria palmicola]
MLWKPSLIMGAAALVHAQADSTGYFPGEPSCALPCLSSAITAAGCQLSDIGCQCGPTQGAIATLAGGCILSSCTDPTDLGAAITAGQAVCSSFFAGELSFTTPGTETPAPTTGSGSESGTTGTTSTGATVTSPPTATTTVSSGGTSGGTESESVTPGATHTDTLIGPSTLNPSSLSSLEPSSPTGAAATPAMLGAGVLAGVMGAVALL